MDWHPLLYQYGLGTLVVALGLAAGARNGVWTRRRRLWGLVIAGGWLLLFAAQGALQWWAG